MNRREILLGGAALALAPSWARAQAARPLKIGVMNDMSGVYADYQGIGSVIAAKLAVEDYSGRARRSRRDRLGRSPEQARRRRGDRPQVVRFGRRRRHHGSAQFGGRAGGGRDRDREEQGRDRFGRRHFGADRAQMLARFRAVDLRHLRTRPRARPRRDQAGRQDLVLHRRRLRFRQGPAGQLRRRRGGRGRQDAGRSAPSDQHVRLSPASCCRRRPPARMSSRSPTRAATSTTR